MSCEEAQLHKERLQALAEKRKRQTEIEGKRSQLDELVLQLQHFKSKAMRERWLLQGAPSGGPEEEEARRRQLEQEEEHGKRLEDMIHRLESEIGTLENEESQISAKEQVLRERLRETERSIEDLQKSLMITGGVDASGCMSHTHPDHPVLTSQPQVSGPPSGEHATLRPGPPSGENASSRPAMFAMEINVQQDPRTGEQRILSANRVNPLDAATRGVKVYDDGKKVVYEVTASGNVATTAAATENGWSSAQVDQLIQRAANPVGRGGDGGRSQVTVTSPPFAGVKAAYVSPLDLDDLSPPSCAPPSVPHSPPTQVTLQRDPQLGMMPPSSAPVTTQPHVAGPELAELTGPPEASAEHPVTMVFLGYQDVDDLSESRRLLGFDGAVKAEVVLIDDDDEKSLREKTVTDQSLVDGTAADLVSGRPATSDAVSTELSSDAREPDSGSAVPAIPPDNDNTPALLPPGLTPATGYRQTPRVAMTTGNGHQTTVPVKHPHTAMKTWHAAQDVSDPAPRERALKSVSFQESVSIITDGPAAITMEFESPQIQHGGLHGSDRMKLENTDTEVAQEIRYLDQVLDAASDTPTNGSSSPSEPNKGIISIDGTSPSVHVSASSPLVNHPPITVEGQRQTTFLGQEDAALRTNGHAAPQEEMGGRGGGGARFELRAFQEERRPAKLFTPGEEQEVRVRRTRPTEEVHELERERQELIKDQAVKKNPVGAQRWWNPPQEVPLEDQLDAEKLESHRKYQERKQQKQSQPYTFSQPQLSGHPTVVTFDPELTRKEDIMEEQIDFTAARKQFLLAGSSKRDVTPQIYSAKPFSKHTGPATRASQGPGDLFLAETGEDEGIGGEFTCARAVMTILRDEEEGRSQSYASFHHEESDSGLDELSIRSQDTTIFSLDNISDSGASLPPTPLPLTPVSPPTPQPATPVNGRNSISPTEDDLEYHAGLLVHDAIQNALAAQNGDHWHPSSSASSPSPPRPAAAVSAEISPLSVSPAPAFSSPVSSSPVPPHPSPQPDRQAEVREPTREGSSVSLQEEHRSPVSTEQQRQHQNPSPSPPQTQAISPPQRPRDGGGPRIKIQSSYARALAASTPAPAPAPEPVAPVPRPTPVYRPPSPPSPEQPEFSYFSKYSEAAELRSTAAAPRGPEAAEAAASGPFRLRSRKQRTLSMIEEEIRAAQQREEELKKQRDAQPVITVRHSAGGPVRTGVMRPNTMSAADKKKSNSLPARLTLTARTAPGKIEKVRPAPPVSPSTSEGALSDAGSEDSSGSKTKNFMQTLMEDYETHKVKKKENMEDNSVLEATRVTRRKSNMALKWEAGIYANEDGDQQEEEEEEEEEEE